MQQQFLLLVAIVFIILILFAALIWWQMGRIQKKALEAKKRKEEYLNQLEKEQDEKRLVSEAEEMDND